MKKIKMVSIFLFFIIKLILFQEYESQSVPKSIDSYKEKIYLRLNNNKILVGNRVVLDYEFSDKTSEKRIVYEFLSLPYARPPIGQLRFQNPVKLTDTFMTSIYDATYPRDACMQDPTYQDISHLPMSESCLYFNIWVPVSNDQDELLFKNNSKLFASSLNNLKYIPNGFLFKKANNIILENDKKTTMFWIHGGAYV